MSFVPAVFGRRPRFFGVGTSAGDATSTAALVVACPPGPRWNEDDSPESATKAPSGTPDTLLSNPHACNYIGAHSTNARVITCMSKPAGWQAGRVGDFLIPLWHRQNSGMSSVWQQLLPMVGVVLGAGGTFAATAMNERVKWRRSQDTRWDDKRLTAYSEYANSLKEYVQLSYRLAAARGYPAVALPMGIEEGLTALAAAEAEKTVKWETVLLLGSPEAVAAARSWNRAAWDLGWPARGHVIEHAEYLRLYSEMGRRRNEFYECARADLGVRTGALPPGDQPWLPPQAEAQPPS